jgi:ketosteroid isomerase-like protein
VSERDVEIVREALDAYNAVDWDRLSEILDPEFELVAIRSLLDGSRYNGHAGFRRFMRDMADEWTEWQVEPEEFRDLGDGRVLVLARFEGRARASGVEVSAPAAWLCELRGDLVHSVRAFSSRAQSLEYLGLEV